MTPIFLHPRTTAPTWGKESAQILVKMKDRYLIPLGLVVIHWSLVAIAFAWRTELVSSIHWFNESLLLKLIIIADLPSFAVLQLIGVEVDVSLMKIGPIMSLLIVTTISFQWLIIGAALMQLLRASKSKTAMK